MQYHGLYGAAADARYKLPFDRHLCAARTIELRGDTEKLKEDIRVYFHNTFEVYEKVYEPLFTDEAFTIQPIHKLRHPMIFYLGHTATFYINKLVVAGMTTRINPKFEKMFAVGVDEMSWDDLNPGHYNWPTVQQVWDYRLMVRDRVNELILRHKLMLPVSFKASADNMNNAFFWIIMMGIEHERIHLETASMHLRELPLRLVKDHPFWAPCTITRGQPPKNELVQIKGGATVVGRQDNSDLYGWDCDYSDHKGSEVESFKASKYLVSNAEYSDFIAEGGYTRREFWDNDGWSYVEWKKPKHPWFWVPKDGGAGYWLRVQTKLIDLPMDWPAEVNHLEAKAFVRWKGQKLGLSLRLPTESEWLRMWDVCIQKDMHEWGPNECPGNLNLEKYASSCPVDEFPQGPLYDVAGNTWQHCETAVYPYRGYRVHPVYDDFSMPTFDGRHFAIKGGAWISTGNEATRDARFAFRRHFFQMVGIRYIEGCAIDLSVQCAGRDMSTVLGMDPEVDQRTQLGYEDQFISGLASPLCFPRDCAQAAMDVYRTHCPQGPATKAMDINCGTGRATFELGALFKQVIGVNNSARPLQCAFALKERGEYSYSVPLVGSARAPKTVHRSNFDFEATVDRVNFMQCDASNLFEHLNEFDLILAWDAIDRSYAPKAVLETLASRLCTGGVLIVITHFSWDAKVTPPSEWLCGNGDDDKRDGVVEIGKILRALGLKELETKSEALTYMYPIRERKAEIGRACLTAWKKH